MKKNIKKIFVAILVLVTIFTSTFFHYEKSNAMGITIGSLALAAVIVGGVCIGCDYLSNPDKYSSLGETMKDFGNATVENQKKLYEIEKSNFEYVMKQAVDAGVGSCIVGSDDKLYSAAQLQAQEYPSFDTWKGYKEKESEKPKKSMWDKFKMVAGLADFLCSIWPDGNGALPDGGSGTEQRYYTGDDGYIDENGNFRIEAHTRNMFHNTDYNGIVVEDPPVVIREYDFNYNGHGDSSTRLAFYMNTSPTFVSYRYDVFDQISYDAFVDINGLYCNQYISFSTHGIIKDNLGNSNESTFQYSTLSSSVAMNDNSDKDSADYHLWTFLSTNAPVFDSYEHMQDYLNNGSLVGLLNGTPEAEPTPTSAPSTISPVKQYVNYFSNTFSPSVMPYHVNYNIVNNWDGNDSTFNINNYTDVTVPTLTPAPDADGNDTNITNNLIINQVNILTEINETVTNIYNFFQIDVDYINEELKMDEDENPTGFDDLKNLISQFEAAFPSDKVSEVTQELDLLYPKITIQVPKALDRFLDAGDDKVIMEDGVKKIVLCDFKDYAIYFARFRKFLEIVLRIGLIFYLLKELTVVFSIA